jgi:putative redox protein
MEVQVTVSQTGEHYLSRLSNGRHLAAADEPLTEGGTDKAFSPDEWLLGALGSCTAITLRMYIARKGWHIPEIKVQLSMKRETVAGQTTTYFDRAISLTAGTPQEQVDRLLQIANACPLHKTLSGTSIISTLIKT